MAHTTTTLANAAFRVLGEAEITNIDGTEARAQAAKAMLDDVMADVQTDFPWQELVETAELTATGNTSDDGWVEYTLPADCLRVLDVFYGLRVGSVEYRWRVEGGVLLVEFSGSLSGLRVRYIEANDTPAEWSQELWTETVYTLAARLAVTLTQNPKIAEWAEAKLEQQRRRLRARCSKARQNDRQVRGGSWREARYR